MRETGTTAMAVDAGRTLLLDREEMLARANEAGIAVVGAGQFGQNHCRVVRQSARAELIAVVDIDPSRATIADYFADYRELAGKVDAAIVATPTSAHAQIGCWLLEHGIDVLVEKPIAPDLES